MKMKTNKLINTLTASALLLGLLGASLSSGVKAAGTSFTDVRQGSWYEATVQWGLSHNMVKGFQDGTFQPNKLVTEEEFLAMLFRAFEKDAVTGPTGHWADIYYNRARELNYPVKSYTELPSRKLPIPRKQVAELLTSAEGVSFNGDDAISYLLAFGLAQGKNPDDLSVKGFDGAGKLTRAEALQFIKNLSEYGVGGLLERPEEASDPRDIPQF
ncbi:MULTISPECIES: S-layer homology domain-containing protein [Paenibacillus]|uniref:S-layer homology domain-containing protein n=1 Tax=Paenibacillus TaxID=44249 RepID=UPI002FE2A414